MPLIVPVMSVQDRAHLSRSQQVSSDESTSVRGTSSSTASITHEPRNKLANGIDKQAMLKGQNLNYGQHKSTNCENEPHCKGSQLTRLLRRRNSDSQLVAPSNSNDLITQQPSNQKNPIQNQRRRRLSADNCTTWFEYQKINRNSSLVNRGVLYRHHDNKQTSGQSRIIDRILPATYHNHQHTANSQQQTSQSHSQTHHQTHPHPHQHAHRHTQHNSPYHNNESLNIYKAPMPIHPPVGLDLAHPSMGGTSAVGATLGAMRLSLMILICVLIVKMRSSSKSSLFNSTTSTKQSNDETTKGLKRSSKRHSWSSTAFQMLNLEPLISIDKFGQQQKLDINQTARKTRRSMGLKRSSLDNQRAFVDPNEPPVETLALPPGPRGLPFVGYLPFLGRDIHLTFTSLSKRFGPIYQLYLGNIRVVVLNDASMVRQAFRQPAFSGRPNSKLTRILQGYGIVNSDGDLWREQRAFLHSALRKLGAKSLMNGSNGLEAKIQHQVKEFIKDLSEPANRGQSVQVRPIVARAVSSVVGSIVMNLTYRKYEEKEKFDRLIELMQEGFRLFSIAMPLDFIPIVRFVPGIRYAYSKMKKNWAETTAFFQCVADEHRKYLSDTFNLGSSCATAPNNPQALHPDSSMVAVAKAAAAAEASAAFFKSGQPQSRSNNQEQHVARANAEKVNSDKATDCDATVLGLGLPPVAVAANEPRSPASSCAEPQANVTAVSLECTETRATANIDLMYVNGGVAQQRIQELQAQIQVEQTGAASSRNASARVELDKIVVRDLVDAYIVQQKKHEKDGKANYFSDQQLVQIMSDIFSAGLETVTSTIEWAILFLILNTDCQETIQNEIDKVIGRVRAPQLEDLAHMPYTEATIYEVLRRSNVIALGNAHATLEDASIAGFRIPKGTQVLPNLYGIHMSPQLWDEPEKFKPERFLINGQATKPDHFIPFSVGRRMCLGDVLAKMEIFLFLIGLLQRYDLSVAPEDRHNIPEIKGTVGVSNAPAAFRVALYERSAN